MSIIADVFDSLTTLTNPINLRSLHYHQGPSNGLSNIATMLYNKKPPTPIPLRASIAIKTKQMTGKKNKFHPSLRP